MLTKYICENNRHTSIQVSKIMLQEFGSDIISDFVDNSSHGLSVFHRINVTTIQRVTKRINKNKFSFNKYKYSEFFHRFIFPKEDKMSAYRNRFIMLNYGGPTNVHRYFEIGG